MRKKLEQLIANESGSLFLSELATVTKENGRMHLIIYISGKSYTYTLSYNKLDMLIDEIEHVIEECLERETRKTIRELYWK